MARFSFPMLDKKEICKHLSEIGSPKLSVENLASPTADALAPVYDFLVGLVDPIHSREELLQPAFGAMDALGDYPGLHTDSIGILKSFRRLREFMITAGAEDFRLFDLHRPEPQRTVRFLSAAINFCMYSQQKIAFVSELHEARDQEIAKAEELREIASKLESEIEAIEQERLSQQPQVQALELEIKELGNHIVALNKQQSSLQADTIKLKQESNSLADKTANVDFALMQKQQEGAQLRLQIVENPEVLQRALEAKILALKEEEALSKSNFETRQKWDEKFENLAKAEKKLSKHQRMLQTLEEQVNARKAAEKEIKDRQARLKAIEKEEWAAEAKQVELNLEVKRLQEQIEKLRQQKNANHDEASKELEASKEKYAHRAAEIRVRGQVITEMKNQIEAYERKSNDLLDYKDETIAIVQVKSGELMKKGVEYIQAILSRTGLEDGDLESMKTVWRAEVPVL